MLGVIEDVTRRVPIGFAAPGEEIHLLGETADELDGSAWADSPRASGRSSADWSILITSSGWPRS